MRAMSKVCFRSLSSCCTSTSRSPFTNPYCVVQEQNICQRYDQLMEAWEKKVERMENNPRRKAKDGRTREYYERQFPEIRKQREQQERFQR